MSSVNRQSLREEFGTLKARFERLCAEGKMGSESRALFQAMLVMLELLMAVFMESRTTQDGKNSSKPSVALEMILSGQSYAEKSE